MKSSQNICLETVCLSILPFIYFGRRFCNIFFFFPGKRKGEPHLFLFSWVVLHRRRKGVICSSFKDPKWRLLLCLYCWLHSQHCLTPASLCKSPIGGFHYLFLSVAFFAFPLVFFLSADIFIFFLLGCFFEKGESRMLL